MLLEPVRYGSHLLLSISEDILMDNSREFLTEFEGIYKQENAQLQNLTFNFGEVRFLDSSGIGAIIKCTNKAKEQGVKINVLNLNKTLQSVFRLSGLQEILTKMELSDFFAQFPEFETTLSKYNE
jgi:anti-anti-sigma factor